MARADAALNELVQALLAEERARGDVRAAIRAEAELLCELRNLGIPTTRVVHRIGAARGVALPVHDRLRLARRLRKRVQRETARRADLSAPHGFEALAAAHSVHRALTPGEQEMNVAKLVKRTVTTEEFVDEKDEDSEDLDGHEADEELDEDEDEESTPVRRRSR